MGRELPVKELVPWGWAPGNYMGRCCDCGDQWHNGDKRAIRCERCAMIGCYTAAERKLQSLAYLSE